jgi:oligogalacturonide transport system substrate-binding protein
MKKMTRIIGLAAFIAGLAIQAANAAETNLRFCWWGGDTRHKPTLAAIKLFEDANPGVKIKGEYMGFDGYQERLTTQLSGGNEPDIMQINWAWISTMFSKNGDGFYDLNQAKSVLKLQEWGTSLSSGIWKGKLNAVPVSFSGRIFVWQKQMFDKAGVAIPKTWDELFAAGAAFKTKLGDDYYPIDGQIYDMVTMTQSFMFQKTGKQLIDPATPKVMYTKAEALEFMQTFKKLTDSHAAVMLKLRYSITTPEGLVEQQQEWVLGKWAGNIVWDSRFGAIKSSLPKSANLVVGDFLTMKGAKAYGIFGRPSQMFAVSKKSKSPLVAAKFINFMMTDPKAILTLGDSRGIPLTKTGASVLEKAGKINEMSRKALEVYNKRKIDMPSAYFEHAKIQTLVRSICEEYALGKTDQNKAAERLISEVNAVLKTIQ